MLTNIRHILLVAVAIAALFLTWPYAIDWMKAGGNILDGSQFFGEPIRMGGTAAFLAIDLLIVWLVFIVWVIGDARKNGLGALGWAFAALSFIAVSMAFPLYIVVKERLLAKRGV
ncbi:MAG: DUF2834 domain-containing protein [Hyphomonadaceae bacterium]